MSYKKIIHFVLALCLVISIGIFMVACESGQAKETTETTVQTEPETIDPIIEKVESAREYIDNMFATDGSFPYHNVEIGKDNSISVFFSFSGTGDVADLVKLSPNNFKKNWSDVAEATISFYQSIFTVLKDFEVETVPLTINLVDDRDSSRLLLSVADGAISYDVVEDGEENAPVESEKSTEQTEATTITTGMKNALKSAKDYLTIMGFSRKGLIEQLEFDGYSTDEATYAANNCAADWNAQAAKKAKSYLEVMGFSRSRLIEQLEYDGFTHEQAVYGAEANGY